MANMQGRSILVTRPKHQAQHLLSELTRLGAVPIELAAIEIREVALSATEKQKIIDLDRYDAIVSVSANAANLGLQWADQYWPQLPSHILWYAVGEATAKALATFGVDAQVAAGGADSEALLELPSLQKLDGQRILLLKGMGGRELLAQTLRARGAEVDSLELYRRDKVQYDNAQLSAQIGEQLPDVILATSVAILESLYEMLAPCYDNLISVNLVVASERIAQAAATLGFQKVVTASGASDQAIIDAISRLRF